MMGELKTWFQQLRRSMLEEREREVQYLQKIQSFRTPFLDLYFSIASTFGEELFYITFLPITAWCIGAREAAHMVVLMLFFCVGLGNWLKNVFLIPRPPHPRVWTPENVQKSDHGFPSTHTVSFVAAPIYFMMYHFVDKFYRVPYYPVTFTTALLVVSFCSLSVIFSRLYNGYHSPLDVLGGSIFGLSLIPLWYHSIRHWVDSLLMWNSIYAPMFALIAALCMVVFHPKPAEPTAALPESGMLFGTCAGTIIAVNLPTILNVRTLLGAPAIIDASGPFAAIAESDFRLHAVRFFIGILIVVPLRHLCKVVYTRAIRKIYPQEKDMNWVITLVKFINYFHISFTILFLIPVLFHCIGLATDYDLIPTSPYPTGYPRQ